LIFAEQKSTRQPRLLFVFFDFLIVWSASWIAFYLRHPPDRQLEVLLAVGPMRLTYYLLTLSVLAVVLYYILGFYRHIWQYASVPQYINLAVGTFLQTCISVICAAIYIGHIEWPIYVIYWMLTLILTCSIRIAYRIIDNSQPYRVLYAIRYLHLRKKPLEYERKRTLIIGAGRAASHLIRDMQEMETGFLPVAIIDDNPSKQNLKLMGIPIVGGRDMIEQAVGNYRVQEIFLAIPEYSRDEKRAIITLCRRTGCTIRQMPSFQEVIDSKVIPEDIPDENREEPPVLSIRDWSMPQE